MQDALGGGPAGIWQPIQQHLLPCTSCPISQQDPSDSTAPSQSAALASQLAGVLQSAAMRTHSALAALQTTHGPTDSQAATQPAAEIRVPTLGLPKFIIPLARAKSGAPMVTGGNDNGATSSLQQWVDVERFPRRARQMLSRMPAWIMHDERGVVGLQMQQLASGLPMPCYGKYLLLQAQTCIFFLAGFPVASS